MSQNLPVDGFELDEDTSRFNEGLKGDVFQMSNCFYSISKRRI